MSASNKNYTVTREGCEPQQMNRQEMLEAMWSARVEEAGCTSYNPRDPGLRHAKDMDLSLFPKKETELYVSIMRGFEDVHLDKLRGMLMELLDGLRVRVGLDYEERVVLCEPAESWSVEIRVTTQFVFRRQHHKYEVGLNTGEDYQVLTDTPHLHEALIEFCNAVFKANIGLKVRHMIRDELEVSGVCREACS